MYAKAAALVAPMSSNTAPRSQVNNAMAIDVTTRDVVNIKCRFILKGSSGK